MAEAARHVSVMAAEARTVPPDLFGELARVMEGVGA